MPTPPLDAPVGRRGRTARPSHPDAPRRPGPGRAPRPRRHPAVAVWLATGLAAALAAGLTGCQQRRVASPEYARPLPPGAPSLEPGDRTLARTRLAEAFDARDGKLIDAIDASLRWFAAPSSQRAFPFTTGDLTVSHERAKASTEALRTIVIDAADGASFADEVLRQFEVWDSVGWDGSGDVLFTGYYAPEFPASRTRTARFSAPLHGRPEDLVTDPVSGTPLGRRTSAGTVPYFTRAEINAGDLMAGREIAWLENELDAYLVHVNGSAKLMLDDGDVIYVGYDGKTDRPYASLGRAMIRDGLLGESGASIPAIRRVFRRQPEAVTALMNENESFVFFTEYGGGSWPSGSLGVKVHAGASVATDKAVFPRGGPVLVDTMRRTFSGGAEPYVRLMLDQDTGGAITAPGRADLFMGTGAAAGILAGEQAAIGGLSYLLLRASSSD
ncbi:MAG: MltA domain-containing protein [Phycisphaerales bacterium]